MEAWLRALQRAVWPVVACIGGEWQPPGTGFFVSKEGVLITAKHIIEPAASKRGRFVNAHGKWDNEGQLFAVGPKDSSRDRDSLQSPHLVPIAISSLPDRGDIAVCQTKRPLPDEVTADFSTLALSPGVPKIGERVYVMGYHKFDVRESWPAEDHRHIHFDAQALITEGTITELHIPDRDPVMAPFPCFTINTAIHGGMSGAPVINEAGFVCGVVSMSSTWEDAATCALIGMALGTTINVNEEDGVSRRTMLLYDLVKEGRVSADESINQVIIEKTAEGTTVSVLVPAR